MHSYKEKWRLIIGISMDRWIPRIRPSLRRNLKSHLEWPPAPGWSPHALLELVLSSTRPQKKTEMSAIVNWCKLVCGNQITVKVQRVSSPALPMDSCSNRQPQSSSWSKCSKKPEVWRWLMPISCPSLTKTRNSLDSWRECQRRNTKLKASGRLREQLQWSKALHLGLTTGAHQWRFWNMDHCKREVEIGGLTCQKIL